ncbi:MAG: glycosyltransferase [Chloroflexota bacterium]|nr:MAG: glycosyl transferase [Bellilinea sp.]
MRITILTYGSRGDVQPCLALAQALQREGHEPLVALPASLRKLADEMKITALALPGDVTQISKGLNRAGRNGLAMVRVIREAVEPVALEVARTAWLACQKADLIVHTFLFTLGAHAFARQLGIPDLSVQFFPMFIVSSDYPNMGFPLLPLGKGYHRLSHHLANLIFIWSQRLMYPRIRKYVHNFPQQLLWPFKSTGERNATPLVLAYSPTLVPPEPDFPAHVHQTGFWFLENSGVYQPPIELKEFLSSGPPPVCISLGSMIHPNSKNFQRVLLEGVQRTGRRVIILTGWDEWPGIEASPELLFLRDAPHEWLFPRCAAIVHHAGAGTTAAVLRSGRPCVALPLAADQPFWARRLHASGVCPLPLNSGNLTAEQVSDALWMAIENESIRRNASILGDVIRRENGLLQTVEIINSL